MTLFALSAFLFGAMLALAALSLWSRSPLERRLAAFVDPGHGQASWKERLSSIRL